MKCKWNLHPNTFSPLCHKGQGAHFRIQGRCDGVPSGSIRHSCGSRMPFYRVVYGESDKKALLLRFPSPQCAPPACLCFSMGSSQQIRLWDASKVYCSYIFLLLPPEGWWGGGRGVWNHPHRASWPRSQDGQAKPKPFDYAPPDRLINLPLVIKPSDEGSMLSFTTWCHEKKNHFHRFH